MNSKINYKYLLDMESILLKEVGKFIVFLEKLTEDEIRALKEGTLKISYSASSIKKCINQKKDGIDVEAIVAELNRFTAREPAIMYLNSMSFTRSELESVIRRLDLPFNKKDNIKKMKDKIIEGTIGYRLSSEAIQSNALF